MFATKITKKVCQRSQEIYVNWILWRWNESWGTYRAKAQIRIDAQSRNDQDPLLALLHDKEIDYDYESDSMPGKTNFWIPYKNNVLFFSTLDDCFEDMDEPLFGLGVETGGWSLEGSKCEIYPQDGNMPKCLLPGESGWLEDDVFPLTSNDRQGNNGLSATRPTCRFSHA